MRSVTSELMIVQPARSCESDWLSSPNELKSPDQPPKSCAFETRHSARAADNSTGLGSTRIVRQYGGNRTMQTSLDHQEDLFAVSASLLTLDTSFRTAKRFALDEMSWVEVVPIWLSGAHLLLQRMMTSVPWRQHDRRMFDQVFREPRLTAQFHRVMRCSGAGTCASRTCPSKALRRRVRQYVAQLLPQRTRQYRLASRLFFLSTN